MIVIRGGERPWKKKKETLTSSEKRIPLGKSCITLETNTGGKQRLWLADANRGGILDRPWGSSEKTSREESVKAR